ncbi:AI-2E family transporter [Variovorax ginsengisoli]|uniref:PurR-regulated permease PerM/GAF domain-containing protein n=1 Tax=Variovorax ginsengisoli TaxID=363844 RepID=A0ABT9SAG8_9BURK|nr:AI-2E family transporter [Variovorax ginsengisoli]MDP9901328.1 putative PurR-regulated permease PerM/GAF domain-containing protein [Variovorax ginsengisoli]
MLPPEPASPTVPALSALVPELKIMAGAVTAAVIVAALYFGRDILMPLALALLLGFVLDPLVTRLKRWGLPRASAVIVVVALALGTLGLAGVFLGTQVSALSAQLPTYQSNIKAKLRNLRESADKPGMFDGVVKTFDAVKNEVDRSTVPIGHGTGRRNDAPAPVQKVEITERGPSAFQQAAAWLQAGAGPLATAGIVLVFVVLVLLDRLDLRDRLLRLWGGNLHRSTDAMDEAGARISKYLTMQFVVNLSYGVPMAAGLWFIGVPGSILWGALAAVMRFVPYLGPMISAVFPLALAFAVDPGWSMVLWTLALIAALEMLSNNVVEPWLYGASTGLSAMSLMVSATFWTALWGPIGLIMSTPLTVCLLVIGRHLPRLAFLDVLLGSQPALDTPTRVYQRLLAGDVEEAIELAHDQTSDHASVAAFYNETGLPVLRMATSDHASVASAEHRHRVVIGMDALIDDLVDQFPEPASASVPLPHAICIGGKWEVDTLAAKMLAHALGAQGQHAEIRPAVNVGADYIARLDLRGAQTVCISYFSPDPQVQARHFCRRLRRRWPDLKIVLALWNAPAELLDEAACKALGADAVVTSISEAVMRVSHLTGIEMKEGFLPAPIPEADAERLAALRASGVLEARAQPLFDAASKRAADIFDMPLAMVTLIDEAVQTVRGTHGEIDDARSTPLRGDALNLPRELSMCGHVVANGQTLVVPDIARDMRFAGNPMLRDKGLRFYAGAPLRDSAGHVLGTLCILDAQPRTLSQREVRLLEAMAHDLMETLRAAVVQWSDGTPVAARSEAPASATVGQMVPSAA